MVVRSKLAALAVVAALGITGCLDRAASRTTGLGAGYYTEFFATPDFSYQLPNGMRVHIVPDFTTTLVEVGMRYRVGSIHDPMDRAGLAHLVEHLLFLQRIGGATQPTLAERIRDVALHYNAFTGLDFTHYLAVAHADDLPRLLELEQQRMSIGCVAIDEASFEREREVVRNEMRLRRGGPGTHVMRWLTELGYPEGHPYRRGWIDDDAQLAAIAYDDACAFIRAHYRPSNAILVVTGRVLPLEAKKLVDRRFGSLPARPAAPVLELPAPISGADEVTRKLDVAATTVYFVWPGSPPHDRVALAEQGVFLQMFLAIVDRLEDEDRIADHDFFTTGGELAPLRVLAVELESGADARAAIDAARAAAATALDEPSWGVLTLYVISDYLRLLSSFESLFHRTVMYADYAQYNSRGRSLTGHLARLARIDEDDVRDARDVVRARGGPRVLIVAPDETAKARYARAPLEYVPAEQPEAAHRRYLDPADAERPLALPELRAKSGLARRFELDNGLEVVMLPSYWVATFSARLVFRAGAADDPADRAGLARLGASLLSLPEGAERIHELLLDYGVGTTTRIAIENDYTELSVHGLEPLGGDIVEALAAWAVDGVYDPEALAALAKRARRRSLATERSALGEYYAAMFGADHPFARLSGETAATLARIGVPDLQAYRRTHLAPQNATLIVTGNFDADELEELVRTRFGGWQRTAAPATTSARIPNRDAPVYLAVERPEATMLSVVIGFPGSAGYGDRHAARRVLAEMLDLRIAAVRDRIGASYGMHAAVMATADVAATELFGTVDPARAGEALALLLSELDALRAGTEIAQDFIHARRQVARALVGELGSLVSSGRHLAEIARYDLPMDFFVALAARVAALTPADVAAVIADELAPARCVMVLAGPRDAIDQAYAAIGVTEVRYVH